MEILEKESIWLKGFPPLMEKVGSATPGKPCVQNDMKVRSKMERKPTQTVAFERAGFAMDPSSGTGPGIPQFEGSARAVANLR